MVNVLLHFVVVKVATVEQLQNFARPLKDVNLDLVIVDVVMNLENVLLVNAVVQRDIVELQKHIVQVQAVNKNLVKFYVGKNMVNVLQVNVVVKMVIVEQLRNFVHLLMDVN